MLKDASSEFKEAKLEIKEGNNEIKDLPDDWASYAIQDIAGADGSPTETTIRVITEQKNRDLVIADRSSGVPPISGWRAGE